MKKISLKIGIFEEANEFNLKIWETPSFLFLIMGGLTVISMLLTYIFARRFEEPAILIISEFVVTLVAITLGAFLVMGVSKMIIINRANKDFISMASHQIRSPLAGVKWSLKTLLDGDLGNVPPEQRNLLVKGYESNERMILLVSDLLNISWLEAEKFSYFYSYEDVRELIKEVISDLAHEAIQHKVELKFFEPKIKLPKVRIDRTKIKMVLQNIIDNAIKYNVEGGKVEIGLNFNKWRDYLEIIIKDTGMGISKNEQKRVFSRFFRASNALKQDKAIGTGLGLFLVKKIIDRHGGKIWFESKENKGTTFHFTLPI